MAAVKEGLLRVVGVLAMFLLLAHFCEGQSEEDQPPTRVTVMVGDDTVLPCQLETPVNAVSMTLEWARPDLDPRFVYVWLNGKELLTDQNKAYKGRASLSTNKLTQGDLSLTLTKVRISDNGIYRCYIPKLGKEYRVELLVGAVSSPSISLAGINTESSGVMLDCRSDGWYPKPEVFWLDNKGNTLSAKTVSSNNTLYTVSSRVTVEKKHNNNFTCRVTQKKTNQTRETHIYVPDDFFMAPSSCAASVAFSVLFGIMFVLAVALLGWKWRQSKNESKSKNKEQKQLMDGREEMEELKKTQSQLNDKLKKKEEEEQKNITQFIKTLTELEKELQGNLKRQVTNQMQKIEKLVEENDKKIKSVDKEVTEKEGDKSANKAQGYLKLKEMFKEANWELEETKKEQQQLQMIIDKLSKKTIDEIQRTRERKKEEENQEQIKEQKEETERRQTSAKEKKKETTKYN